VSTSTDASVNDSKPEEKLSAAGVAGRILSNYEFAAFESDPTELADPLEAAQPGLLFANGEPPSFLCERLLMDMLGLNGDVPPPVEAPEILVMLLRVAYRAGLRDGRTSPRELGSPSAGVQSASRP